MELERVLAEQQGVITSAQAKELLTPAAVRHRLATGRWRRCCRGVLVTTTGPLTLGQQRWLAVLAAGPRARLGGLAAARTGGLRWPSRDGRIDVLVPVDAHCPDLLNRMPLDMPAVKVRRAALSPADCQVGRPPLTSMARSVVDAAAWARSDDDAQGLVAAACQQRLVTPAELLAVAKRLSLVRRHALIVATAQDAAGGATALSEIDLLRLCRRHGLPEPVLQDRRRDAAGRVRYRDAYWPGYRLHVEVDGGHHMEVRHWEADLRRQNDIWTSGDRILRFTAYQVRSRPDEVAAAIRAALIAAGWPESSGSR